MFSDIGISNQPLKHYAFPLDAAYNIRGIWWG